MNEEETENKMVVGAHTHKKEYGTKRKNEVGFVRKGHAAKQGAWGLRNATQARAGQKPEKMKEEEIYNEPFWARQRKLLKEKDKFISFDEI